PSSSAAAGFIVSTDVPAKRVLPLMVTSSPDRAAASSVTRASCSRPLRKKAIVTPLPIDRVARRKSKALGCSMANPSMESSPSPGPRRGVGRRPRLLVAAVEEAGDGYLAAERPCRRAEIYGARRRDGKSIDRKEDVAGRTPGAVGSPAGLEIGGERAGRQREA